MRRRPLPYRNLEFISAMHSDFFPKAAEADSRPVRVARLRRIAHAARSFVVLPATWWRRSVEREQLRELSDHLLKDIGITRAQADWEANKSFWIK